MKRIFVLGFAIMALLTLSAYASEPLGVVANNNTNSIQLINPLTMEISPSMLKGNLGSYGGGLFDVVFTPNGKKAFVSNFGDSQIHAIDTAGGFQAEPTIIGSVNIPFFAEDMDVTPDGTKLLVTDGGFSPRVAVVDVESLTLIKQNYLRDCYANAISIHPSGKYFYVADYFQGAIHGYALASDGTATFLNSVYLGGERPVNVTVSPDGKTMIAVMSNTYSCHAFAIGDGNFADAGRVELPAKGGQSCVFSKDGTKVYYLSNSLLNSAQIQVLNVTGAGLVAYASSIEMSIPRGTSQLFGVDTLAVDPAGTHLFVANPTVSGGVVEVTVIDLTSNTETAQLMCNGIPTGIAFATIQ
jgi:DNA-binding beta-propeller fold protein YncE